VSLGALQRLLCVAGCWVHIPNDAACASASYRCSCAGLLGFFFFRFLCEILHEKINVVVRKMSREFNSGAKGLMNGAL
jgi:hypothetical protein